MFAHKDEHFSSGHNKKSRYLTPYVRAFSTKDSTAETSNKTRTEKIEKIKSIEILIKNRNKEFAHGNNAKNAFIL